MHIAFAHAGRATRWALHRFLVYSTTCTAFSARRYASVVYAVVVCPSVRLSVRHKPILYQKA